jgi:hypothetical protein
VLICAGASTEGKGGVSRSCADVSRLSCTFTPKYSANIHCTLQLPGLQLEYHVKASVLL